MTTLKQKIEDIKTTNTTKQQPVFSMIKRAHTLQEQAALDDAVLMEGLTTIAEQANTTVGVVAESVTHIIANLRNTVQQRKPIELMHLNSVAAFLAGVEAISIALPKAPDGIKKSNTIRALAVSGISNDGTINMATYPIIMLGAKKEMLKAEFDGMLKRYAVNPEDHSNSENLIQKLGTLQMKVDRAMRQNVRSTISTPPQLQRG